MSSIDDTGYQSILDFSFPLLQTEYTPRTLPGISQDLPGTLPVQPPRTPPYPPCTAYPPYTLYRVHYIHSTPYLPVSPCLSLAQSPLKWYVDACRSPAVEPATVLSLRASCRRRSRGLPANRHCPSPGTHCRMQNAASQHAAVIRRA